MARRFIAGAVCPACQAVDRLVVEFDEHGDAHTRRCVACGFADDAQAAGTGGVPRGKFEKARGSVAATPVRLMDPGADPAGKKQ